MNLKRYLSLWRWAVLATVASAVLAWSPIPVPSYRPVFMPGTQPGTGVTLEASSGCQSCHAGMDPATEPWHTWQGSMMAQAGRDPLWFACLVVAAQDSIWALGNPNAADLCIRCHAPGGWMEGRSDPPNLTALSVRDNDFDGINCDFCHKMVDPILARRQMPELPAESIPSHVTEAQQTYDRDKVVLSAITLFDSTPFLDTATEYPTYYGDGALPHYIEATTGQYFLDPQSKVRRAARVDVNPASHSVLYSRFHKSKHYCAACHDVSNPVLSRVIEASNIPERQAGATYYHVERTFSEFMLSAYGQDGGAPTNEAVAARGIAHAASCQDCHMPRAVGRLSNKNVPVRDDLAVHDLTGANTWIGGILASVDASGPVYNAYNNAILTGKYPGASIDQAGLQGVGQALVDGVGRSRANLRRAATFELVESAPGNAVLRIRNNTGHKLISGFPEGRRMRLNIQFLDSDGHVMSEINPYLPLATSLDAGGNVQWVSGGDLVVHRDDLVFETKMASTLTGEAQTFHFVLATSRYKDNRIPPRGFRRAEMSARDVTPRAGDADAPDYFSEAEYAGGYHDVTFPVPLDAAGWRARLYYQTTSRDYVAFLRDQINGIGGTLSSPTPSGEPQSYIVQTDPFFSTLKGWGSAIWDLWLANGGSPPELMTAAISPPRVVGATMDEAGYRLHFHTIAGWSYRIERSETLETGSWTILMGPVTGTGAAMQFHDPDVTASSRAFYRLIAAETLPGS